MPGKVIKETIKKVIKPIPKPKPKKKIIIKNKNKNIKNKKNLKDKDNKGIQNVQNMSTKNAAKVILKNTGVTTKNVTGKILKYGTFIAGLKETLGDWTGLTDLIMGKNKPPKNKENYDADPGLKKGDDLGGHNYNKPSAFKHGGESIYTDKGVKVPGMKTGGNLKKGKKGYFRD